MSLLQRLWDAIGLGEPPDEVEYDGYPESSSVEEASWQAEHSPSATRTAASNVVGMPGRAAGQAELLLMEPRSFEEAPQAVTALKQRKTVILNLNLLDADTAQRCVDFVAGGVFAIDGHQERIGETIFLFTPGFVQISNYASSESIVSGEPPVSRATATPRRSPLNPTHPLGEEHWVQ